MKKKLFIAAITKDHLYMSLLIVHCQL